MADLNGQRSMVCVCVYTYLLVCLLCTGSLMCYVIAMNGTSKLFNELEALADRYKMIMHIIAFHVCSVQ